MKAVLVGASLLMFATAAQATVEAPPCTSDQGMVAALTNAIDTGDLSLAEPFLSDAIIYGDGAGFKGKRQVITAFGTTEWEGPPSRLVFATSDTLFFQRRTKGVHEQLISFDCNGGKVVAVNMHRRNGWIEAFGQPPATVADKRGEK